jgi:hypothetical protein
MAQPLANDAVDLLLDGDNDLVVTTDLEFARGTEGVAQLCRIAVQTFAGEWFLDLDVGIPYWEQILGANPEAAIIAARAGFHDELLATDGVTQLLVLNATFDNAQSRALTVEWQVGTATGDTVQDTLTFATQGGV